MHANPRRAGGSRARHGGPVRGAVPQTWGAEPDAEASSITSDVHSVPYGLVHGFDVMYVPRIRMRNGLLRTLGASTAQIYLTISLISTLNGYVAEDIFTHPENGDVLVSFQGAELAG
eukprot:197917-Prymnesium_polylepis.1